jgi:hypothetical protein
MNYPKALEFEKNFESVLAGRVSELGFTPAKAREKSEFTSDTIDVLFELGEAIEGDDRIQTDSTTEYLSYTGTAVLIAVTNRARQEPVHTEILARLRWLMLKKNNLLNSQYYKIQDIRAMGTEYNFDADNNLDISTLSYGLIFSIISM